jgi:hypothetical protein
MHTLALIAADSDNDGLWGLLGLIGLLGLVGLKKRHRHDTIDRAKDHVPGMH